MEQQIRDWVALDNKIKQYSDAVQTLRKRKQALGELIVQEAETQQKVNVPIKVGKERVKVVSVKDTQLLTFKYLDTCLHHLIKNKEQATKILDYIKEHRRVVASMEVKRLCDVS